MIIPVEAKPIVDFSPTHTKQMDCSALKNLQTKFIIYFVNGQQRTIESRIMELEKGMTMTTILECVPLGPHMVFQVFTIGSGCEVTNGMLHSGESRCIVSVNWETKSVDDPKFAPDSKKSKRNHHR